jgi:hypothetical protein
MTLMFHEFVEARVWIDAPTVVKDTERRAKIK